MAVPSTNGLYRQPPNIPSTIPQNLPTGLLDRNLPNIPNKIPSNLPRGLSDTGQQLPTPKQNLPIPQTPTPTAKPNIPASLGNGLATASGAIAVGTSIANAASNPSIRNAIGAALDVGTVALSAIPNPYAQGAALLLQGGKILYNLFTPPENTAKVQPFNAPFTGGQTVGVLYKITLDFTKDLSAFGGGLSTATDYELGTFQGAIGSIGGQTVGTTTVLYVITSSGRFEVAVGTGSFVSTTNIRVTRVDGQPEDDNNPSPIIIIPSPSNTGQPTIDLDGINDKLDSLKNAVTGLSDGLNTVNDGIQNLRLPQANNGMPMARPDYAPQLLKAPSDKPDTFGNRDVNPSDKIEPSKAPKAPVAPNSNPNGTPTPTNNVSKQNTPLGTPLVNPSPTNQGNKAPTNLNDRFKDPRDCNFSCTNLANCFVDVEVEIFDKCNDDGTAKTKKITIQALPKDKNKTIETFKQLLDIQSKECALEKNVVTVPDYWQTRVGQIPQAIILYKSIPTDGSKPSYYQLQIPHYNGSRNSKPKISEYTKGNEYALYYCKDGSSIQVNASTRQECLRVINELEKYINPRMRANDKSGIKYGTRKGLANVRVKPIRLDYSPNGQADKNPLWSVNLKK